MLHTDPTLISDARSAYDRACGAVTGSDYTGFLLALSVGFWVGDHPATAIVPTLVIQFIAALLVLAIVRSYYRRHLLAAEDTYHRLAGNGKYATAPSIDDH